MNKSKKIFLLVAVCFLSLLFYASYDIARRTTFPGKKAQLKERIKNQYLGADSSEIKGDPADSSKFFNKKDKN